MHEEDIRKLLTTKKLIIGEDEVLKNARTGKLLKVYHASNANTVVLKDLAKYSHLSGFELLDTKLLNVDLGTTCKKPFSISLVGVLK